MVSALSIRICIHTYTHIYIVFAPLRRGVWRRGPYVLYLWRDTWQPMLLPVPCDAQGLK